MTIDPKDNRNPKIRWLKSQFTFEELSGKRVFARFVPSGGLGYEGTGEIRVLENPKGLLAVDLVFTRRDSYDKFTDIVFHLSARQLRQLRKAPDDAEYDFEYDGTLSPDEKPDTAQNI